MVKVGKKECCKKAYARGYQATSAKWPEHKPPKPPHPIICELVAALEGLRNGVDSELSTFEPDDELNTRLGPFIDRADEALGMISRWLRDYPQ